MLREVEILADLHWRPHYQVKHYEGEWSAIPLRSIDGKSDNIIIHLLMIKNMAILSFWKEAHTLPIFCITLNVNFKPYGCLN